MKVSSKGIKKAFLRVFLLAELSILLLLYCVSPYGLQARCDAEQENTNLNHSIKALEQEICLLRQQLVLWDTRAFKKEKIAREELQLAAPGDIIYFID